MTPMDLKETPAALKEATAGIFSTVAPCHWSNSGKIPEPCRYRSVVLIEA